MELPKFSIALIARNESKTLPRLLESLKEFQTRGGEVLLLDTGSTDDTALVAHKMGCRVFEVGDKFRITINNELAKKINDQFIVEGEQDILKGGDTLFDYSSARNYISQFASNDVVATPDCDEIYTKFDIDKINEVIASGVGQLEYNFVFSHDKFGNEALKFLHSKFYNKKKLKWQGIVHEVLAPFYMTGSSGLDIKRQFLGEDIIKLEHWQNPETNRGGYLKGLALDCYMNPDNDRNSHYFARELLWTGHPKSAIKEFERHIAMDAWPSEKAQSYIFMGDCYGQINEPDEQVACYNMAFHIDSTRNESLLRLAGFYKHNKNYQAAICYAKAALELNYSGFYADNVANYREIPHSILYESYGWLGNIEKAQEHLLKCLEYQPLNSAFLRDYRYYFQLPMVSIIIPTLMRPEGLQRCLDSIKKLNYPDSLIETLVYDGEGTVPEKVSKGVKECQGEYICYMANDTEMTPDSLILAILESIHKKKGLVAFNTEQPFVDSGNICEHFIIRKDLVKEIGEIFNTKMKHVGVDALLWAKCEKLNEATRCDSAIVHHYHFTKGAKMDEIYDRAYSSAKEDREILKQELNLLLCN